MRALLAAGADVNAATDEGDTALIRASFSSHFNVVRALLDAGANQHLANSSGNTASSAFMQAPASTAAIMIRALLEDSAAEDLGFPP